jgi:hypothetical protein
VTKRHGHKRCRTHTALSNITNRFGAALPFDSTAGIKAHPTPQPVILVVFKGEI